MSALSAVSVDGEKITWDNYVTRTMTKADFVFLDCKMSSEDWIIRIFIFRELS